MNSFKHFKCLLILIVLCFMNLGSCVQNLGLSEGATCNTNGICKPLKNCASAVQGLKNNTRPIICSVKGSTAIVCCPQSVEKPSIASQMCYEYSKLIYTSIFDPALVGSKETTVQIRDCIDVKSLIIGGENAEPKEFPHMALLSNKETPSGWVCGGSLISNRWILSAAHCQKDKPLIWARLGEINYLQTDDNSSPEDYKIIVNKPHPNYNGKINFYYDIVLLKLDKDVTFSPFIRPVCLNVESSIKGTKVVATGWGVMDDSASPSENLLKVTLDIHPMNECTKVYINNSNNDRQKLPQGLNDDSQICVGVMEGGKDTCQGDSGGPIQIKNSKYECMFTQIGITSFGRKCAAVNTPAIYTKVSYYIPWIEDIVWPKQ